MEIQPRINRYIKWFSCPDEITFLMAFILFSVSIVLLGFMVVCYDDVLNDSQLIHNNLEFRMLQESDSFMENIKQNVCGNQLLKDYQWLLNFSVLIQENCHVTSSNLKYLQVIGYVVAGYNMFLIHVLFNSTLGASTFASIPLLIAFFSIFANPEKVFILGLFNFTQVLLSIIIMITFIYLKEKKLKSQLALKKRFE